MKTKTNKVPLVGPRGRRELLDRIEELEKKVIELATTQPETHVLEILSVTEEHETGQELLARMKLDGQSMRAEDFNKLDILNTYLVFNGTKYAITQFLNADGTRVYICAGFASPIQDTEATLVVQFDDSDSLDSYINFNEV